MAKAKSLHALDFLKDPAAHTGAAFCVVFGDEPFLKRQVLVELQSAALGDDDAEFSLTTLESRNAEWRDVLDELSTLVLFGSGKRVVLIEDADDFVSRYRTQLEEYAAQPAPGGVLMLGVRSWPSNTRVYKAVAAEGLAVDCNAPKEAQLLRWMTSWSKKQHRAKLDPVAAEMLLDQVEPHMGLLDQELAKLALVAGEGETITPEIVQQAVGTWRTKTTWDMLDAALAGNGRGALEQFDRLILSGETPLAVLGQIAFTLRRFAAATRIIEQAERSRQRVNLTQALGEAGFKTWPAAMQKAEAQLRHLGRRRGAKIYAWLREADLALKGSASQPSRARLELEKLIVLLAVKAEAVGLGRR
jgi:DNA polymerase-3 subunit delta